MVGAVVLWLLGMGHGVAGVMTTETVVQPYLGITPAFGKWSGPIPWVYNPTNANVSFTDSSQIVALLQEAMAEWEAVSGVRFVYQGMDANAVDSAIDNKVVVRWDSLGGWAAYAEALRDPGAMEQTKGYIPYNDGRILLSATLDWTKKGLRTGAMVPNALKKTLLHEIGHLIGLGHSDNPVSVMYANPYNYIRHLTPDDIAAAQAWYGPPASVPVPVVPYVPPSATETILLSGLLFLASSGDSIPVTTLTDATANSDALYLKLTYASGTNKTIEIMVTDPGGHIIQESAGLLACPGPVACSQNFAIGIYSPDVFKSYPGQYQVYVVADGKRVAQLPLTVATNPVWNQPPNAALVVNGIVGVAPFTVNATVTASDPEGDSMQLTWHIPGQGAVSAGFVNGSASRSMTFATPGVYELLVAIGDNATRYTGVGPTSPASSAGEGGRKVLRQVITVNAVNLPPTLQGTPPTKALQEVAFTYTPTAQDPEGAVLLFSIENKPVWLTLDPATGRLWGTPTATDIGKRANIILSVSDGIQTVALPPFALDVVAFNLDIDANGQYDPLTDGLLIARYLSGLRDAALVAGVVGVLAARPTATAIAAYLAGSAVQLDVDQSGGPPALLNDGVLILRYLFGFRDAALLNGTPGNPSTLESTLRALMPIF